MKFTILTKNTLESVDKKSNKRLARKIAVHGFKKFSKVKFNKEDLSAIKGGILTDDLTGM